MCVFSLRLLPKHRQSSLVMDAGPPNFTKVDIVHTNLESSKEVPKVGDSPSENGFFWLRGLFKKVRLNFQN